jgi:RNA polymerase I-specific transcription initiation factor RRN3
LIPAGSAALATTLSSGFPTDTDTPKAHIAYTRNLLKITSYAPELKAEILALITEKIVKTDVQVQVDMEDLEEEMEDDILQSLSSAEDIALGDDEDSDGESVASVEEELDANVNKLKMTKTNLYKIDYMMDMLFEYYAMPFAAGSLDDQENTLQLLLAHFENIILPTYRSRHSQFLLFHFAQSSPILVDRFSASCIQIIFSKSHPTVIRQYAAAYLASFVARGKHVSGEVVRDVFDLLGSHLHSLLIEYEPACRGPDLRRYGTFYSMAQALLYIFCFRWRDLTTAALEEEEEKKGRSLDNLELDEVRFPPNITETMRDAVSSALNPLKVCSPNIVEEFARLAHHLNFLYVYSIIEMNKRVRVQSSRGFTSRALNSQFGQIERETRADDNRSVQLDAYFPFDPYHLRRSGRWLEDDYVAWRGIPGLQNRDDDSDSRGAEEEFMEDEAEESDEE